MSSFIRVKRGNLKNTCPHSIVKKKQHLHKIKNKITRIFQLLLSIIKKLEIIGGKSDESGDLDGIFYTASSLEQAAI
ncbi:hypothetical protein ACSFCC_05970 [Glaesserella parasuis]|uniref:hypothetical protein n=1 Tax=Glaesserella parasuis TaxID=738 RepID=UPI0027255EA1|nr:hypothetical protein [Glaesserella parasuis]